MAEAAARRPIVFVDHSSQPGGGQLSLLRYLQQTAISDVRLVVFAEGMLSDRAAEAGIRTEVLPSTRSRLKRLWLLRRSIAGTRSTVVSNSLKSAFYLSALPKGRNRFVYYMREDLSREWLTGPRRWLTLGYSLRRFDAFIANSRWTESTLPANLARRPHTVAYPVSGAKQASAPRTERQGPIRVLSLSRLSHWKGVHVLVDALVLLGQRGLGDRFEVTIAGDDVFDGDPYVARLRERAASSGADIRFVGHVDDVAGLLAANDVLVSCSLAPEPFGQVIVQSLANGLVTVATAMGGPKEVMSDGVDGLLVRPDDPGALADALAGLDADRARMGRIALGGLATATRYLDPSTVIGLDRALDELAARATV